MRHPSRIRAVTSRRGLSLVEILIAASLIAVALLAIASMFPTAYTNVEYGGRLTKAHALAQQKIEELRNGTFPPSSGSDSTTTPPYTVTWQVDSVGFGTSSDDLRKVTVTVTWPQRTRPRSVQLVSFIGKPY